MLEGFITVTATVPGDYDHVREYKDVGKFVRCIVVGSGVHLRSTQSLIRVSTSYAGILDWHTG